MLRTILCGVLGVAILAGCNSSSGKLDTGPSEQRGRGPRGQRARGTLVSVDPAAGTLTVKARSRQKPDGEEKTYQVTDETTIISFTGQDKAELKGKDGLNDPQFKPDAQVALTLSEDGSKVVSIQVGDLPQRRGRGNRGGGQGPMQ